MAVTSTSSAIDSLVQQYKSSLTSKRITPLSNKKTSLNAKLTVLNTLKSRMKTLYDTADAMTKTDTTSKFLTYSAVSSSTAVLTAAADSTAAIAAHSLFVSRLAKTDSVITSRFTSANTTIANNELTTAEKTAGSGIRQIKILQNGVEKGTISVTLLGGTTTDSNQTVLNAIATAINSTTGVKDSVIASVISVTSTQSKLVISSKNSGASNSLTLQDVSTGTLLDNIGLGDATISGRTAASSNTTADDPVLAPGGYLYSGSSSLLNASFTVDGVDIERESNTVSDVLTGVSISLKSVQNTGDAAVSLSVDINKDQIKANVQKFLTDYNSVISYIKAQTAVDPVGKVRQILATESVYTATRITMQDKLTQVVDTVTSGNPNILSKIGIATAVDGTLSITDNTKFLDALATSTTPMSELFISGNGYAVKMKTLLNGYVTSKGYMDSATTGVNDQLTTLNKKITAEQSRIDKLTIKYRDDYAKLQTAYNTAVQQLSTIQSILGYATTSY